MNRIYRLVFSAHVGDLVVAGENARRSSGGARHGIALAGGSSVQGLFALLGLALFAVLAYVLLLQFLAATAGIMLATVASGVNKQVKYKVEGSWGTIPAAAGSQRLRRVTSDGNLDKETFESREIVSHMQRLDYRHGVRSADYVLNGELSPGTYKDFMAAAVRRAYAAITPSSALSVTISGTGPTYTVARAAGSWLTDGEKVGQVGRLTAGSFNAANLNKNLVILGVTALNLTVMPLNGVALLAEGPIGSATWTPTGKVTFAPASGHTDLSYSIEDWHPDLSPTASEVFSGQKVNRVPVRVPAKGLCEIDFEFLGKDITTSASEYFTTPTTETTTGLCAAHNGLIVVQGASIGTVTGLDFAIFNEQTGEAVTGSTTRQDITEGRILVEGSLIGLFDSVALRDYFIQETEIAIAVILPVSSAAGADFVGFTLPRAKLGGAKKDDGVKSLMRTCPFTALYNVSGGAGISSEQTTISLQDSQA